MLDAATHYVALAAAYARGALRLPPATPDADALAAAARAELRLHRFKRTMELRRLRPVLGALRGFAAEVVVDVGSGRGAFVWPLLDAFPALALTCVDVLDHRARLYADLARGGYVHVAGLRASATALPLADASADVVTALEVLEHLPDDGPARAARELVRVARRAVIVSVPAHADDNPEHVQLFTGATLTALFEAAGARRVALEHVLDHLVAVVTP